MTILPTNSDHWLCIALTGVVLWTATLTGCATVPESRATQMAFTTPQSAAQVLVMAARGGSLDDLLAILGPEAREIISSGDPVADRADREVILAAFSQHWALEDIDAKRKELVIGYEAWPFPIPLIKDPDGWRFDTVAGKQEVQRRRIGRNELAAMSVCLTYVAAQIEYASEGRDGHPAGIYAQKVHSTAGRHDGLYWPDADSIGKPSPLSRFAAQARAEGYATDAPSQPRPFHGYYFRILTAQGAVAPGGARSYIVDGQMSGGFALIAWPVDYGNSGIMSFIVNHDGVVYERDLGVETEKAVRTIESFNPGADWRQSETDVIFQR